MSTQAQAGPRGGLLSSISAFARLGNARFYYHWYPVVVAWVLLPKSVASTSGAIAVLVLGVLCAMSFAFSAGSLDDVQGIRDNLDQNTYAPSEELRSIRDKPLLLGEVTETQAEWFGRITCAVGLALGVLIAVVAPHSSWLALALLVLSGLAGVQYSYGLKISYHGFGEGLIALVTGMTTVIAYLLAAGDVPARVAFVGAIVGLWFAQIPLFSNTADADKDRVANRRTIATRLDRRGNNAYIGSIFVLGWCLTAITFAKGWLPPALAVGLAPVWAMQVGQLVAGFRDQNIFRARLLGRQAYDLALFMLTVILLVDRYT